MYELYGRLGAEEEKDGVAKLRDAFIAIGIAGTGMVVITTLIAKEFYSARERRMGIRD